MKAAGVADAGILAARRQGEMRAAPFYHARPMPRKFLFHPSTEMGHRSPR